MAKRKGSVAPSTLSGSKATRRRFLSAATAGGVAAWSGLTIFSRRPTPPAACASSAWPGYDEKPVVEEFEETEQRSRSSSRTTSAASRCCNSIAQSPKGTFDAIISDAEYVQKFVGAEGARCR